MFLAASAVPPGRLNFPMEQRAATWNPEDASSGLLFRAKADRMAHQAPVSARRTG